MKKACERYQDLSEEEQKKRQCARESYRKLSGEEKNKKQQYSCEWNKHLPEVEKQKLVDYRKIYSNMRKNKDWLMFLATQDFF